MTGDRMQPDLRTRRDWEDLGRIDPEWAILSEPEKRLGGWDEREFFERGREEVARVLARADELGISSRRGSALDVGCGIGRLTVALAEHFDTVVGVDISGAMLDRARSLHSDRADVRFERAPADDLSALEPASFDFVLTRLVLQHLPTSRAILRSFEEMLRVLAPGGLLVAQTTSALPLRHRIQPRPRLYAALRSAGLPPDLLYRRLHLQPVRMTVAPRSAVEELLHRRGARIHGADTEPKNAGAVWTTYYVTRS